MICIRKIIYLLPVFNFISYIQANVIDDKLLGIVKVSKANVRDRNIPLDKYIVDSYSLETVVELEYCDRYDWCKLKDKNLYMSKVALGTMVTSNKVDMNTTVTPEQADLEQVSEPVETPCIKLTQIDVDENEILDRQTQDRILKPYMHKCVDANTVKGILQTISQYYIKEGYITTKPYLKEQDIKDSQLDVSVSIGLVEDIVDAKTKEPNGRIYTAFILQKGELLNLRDLETSLEMVNRVPSVDAKFDILPGTQSGSSIVQVNTQETRPYHLTLGAIGEKSSYDNDPYLTADASIDNPLNIRLLA